MLTYSIADDVILVRLHGELDHHSAVKVRGQIDTLIDDNTQIKRLVFDLSELEFMDSSGIGVVIGRYKRMAAHGGKVSVRRPGKHVDRIFQMSGLYQIIEKE